MYSVGIHIVTRLSGWLAFHCPLEAVTTEHVSLGGTCPAIRGSTGSPHKLGQTQGLEKGGWAGVCCDERPSNRQGEGGQAEPMSPPQACVWL